MTNFNPAWYVIYTRPRHERKVVDHLAELNIETFLPRIVTLRQWHDRKKYIEMPLFPSYVFVHLRAEQDYFESLSHESILYYLRTGKKIASISTSTIDDVRMIVNNYRDIEVSTDNFLPGKKLSIKEGPFTGYSCEVVEYCGKKKIIVRVELLQRSVLVNLSVDSLIWAKEIS
jgi:transcription antitermination factor NusG